MQAELCNKRLGRAGKLTNLLGDELVRWACGGGGVWGGGVQQTGIAANTRFQRMDSALASHESDVSPLCSSLQQPAACCTSQANYGLSRSMKLPLMAPLFHPPVLRRPCVCAVRWGVSASELGDRLELLVGDALLAAAVVNYLGPFPGET
jgi:hypothetical protein